jgi:multiple sugar transport system substrate-binding protein
MGAGCSSDQPSQGPSDEKSPASGSAEITVGYAGGGATDTYMEEIIAHAEENLDGVTITPVVYPTYDDQLNQMPTEFAAGTAPDIIMWDNAAPVAQYAVEGAIVPLDELLDQVDFDAALYPDALVRGWNIEGEQFGIPAYLQNSGMVYNMDVLSAAGVTELPATIAELGEVAKQVHAANPDAAGLVILDNLFHITQYLYAFGGGYDYGRTIDSPENVAGLEFLVGLFADGSAATAQQLGATWDGEAIASGTAAMSDAGPWYIGFMATTGPDVNYRLEAIPTVKADQAMVATYGGGFSITSAAQDTALAARVLGLLTDSFSQEAIITTGLGFVPAMTVVADTYRDSTPEYASFTEAVLAQGHTLDYPLETIEFGNDLVAGFQQMVADPDNASPQPLLSELQDKYGRE